MRKIQKIILLMIIVLLSLGVSTFAASFNVDVKLEKQADNEYILKLFVGDISITGAGINAFMCDLEYDREVFETVKQTDITLKNGWGDFIYNDKNGTMLTLRNDFTKEAGQEILEIKLKPKADAKGGKTQVKITNIQVSDSQTDIEAPEKIIDIKTSGNGTIIKNILIIVLFAIVILFVIKTIVKAQVKRRKRR